jgi:hypothetical protein
MKQALRIGLYLIMVLLVLEVVKTILVKAGVQYSFSIAVVIASLQMLFVLAAVLVPLLFKVFKKRTQHTRKALKLSFLSFFIIIAFFEGVCTLLMHNADKLPGFLRYTFDFYYNTYARSIIQFNSKASVYDPQLFYTLKPNARFRFVNAEFNTAYSINRLGLRDDDSSLNKPAIISIGDSYGMGWGVEQDSTYSQQLEALSHQKVLNTAISSYGTAREITSLHRFDTSAMKCLVIQYYDNDVEENTDYIKNNHVLKISTRQVYDKTVQSEKVASAYYPGKHFLNISQLFIKQQVNKVANVFPLATGNIGDEVTGAGQATLFLKVLSDAPVDFTRSKVIVLFPSKDFGRSRAFESALDSLLQTPPFTARFSNNMKVLKVSELLQADDYYIMDIHLRNSGHRKIAEGLWKMMQAF